MSWISRAVAVVTLTLVTPVASHALVTCAPDSCTPACNSSCTYYTCTEDRIVNVPIRQLPFSSYEPPADACADSGLAPRQIPFDADGRRYQSVPTTVEHHYTACQAQTNFGPPCP